MTAAAWGPLTDRLFEGDEFLTAMLVVGVVLFSVVYVGRGVLGGVRWFRGYAASLCIDGVMRMLMAAPLVLVASERLAAVAVVGAGVIGIGAPLAARAGDLRRLLTGGRRPRSRSGRRSCSRRRRASSRWSTRRS